MESENLDELKNKIRLFIRKLDPELVQRLMVLTIKFEEAALSKIDNNEN